VDQQLTTILPCNDLDVAQAFFELLSFAATGGPDDFRMMSDIRGGMLHLNQAVEGWLVPGRNPFGLYLYREDVDAVAAASRARSSSPRAQATNHGACMSSR
jgi:hypothetical protein